MSVLVKSSPIRGRREIEFAFSLSVLGCGSVVHPFPSRLCEFSSKTNAHLELRKMIKFAKWHQLLIVLGISVLLTMTAFSETPSLPELRKTSQQQQMSGNFKNAYEGFKKLCLAKDNDRQQVGEDLRQASFSLQRLGRSSEFDELVESTVVVHKDNWRLLQAAAEQYLSVQHHGFMIGGKFERGNRRGGGRAMNAFERDRVRALQLLDQAVAAAKNDDNKAEVGKFYLALSEELFGGRGNQEAWRLQTLTNLAELPDYEEGFRYGHHGTAAPVDEAGKPVYYSAPKSWETATNDGQRWRWALSQAVENNAELLNQVRTRFAGFLQSQFGVQTMANDPYSGRMFGAPAEDDTKKNESGTYALHTLKENETIAKLANGIKRFELPDEFNFVKIYQQIADEPKTGHGEDALNALAQIFENRRQYPRAAEFWKISIDRFGAGNNNWKKDRYQQIVANWGTFEPNMTQPAGQGAKIGFRFRNANAVEFEAHELSVGQLLDDLKAYLKSDPGQLDWNKVNIGDLGWRVVQQQESKYVGEKVASWKLPLEPRPGHFDKRMDIATPLQKPGAYLVTATVAGGNVSKIVAWISDTAIVRKPLSGKSLYFVADSVTGKPIQDANLEFFGYHQKHLGGNRWQILTTNFAEKTDANGQIIPDPRDLKTDYQWLVIARGSNGRFAHLGFQNVWANNYYDADYNQTKAFMMTDRPVYRPRQPVHFKFWVRHTKYDQPDTSDFAKQTYPVEIHNPKGDKIYSQTLTTDEYAGSEGTLELPADATLGQYHIHLPTLAQKGLAIVGNTFRVEEYKKPEYEVTVAAPTEPVMLGEKISAKISAKYFFGSPVTKATVKYKVQRADYSRDWYPTATWDWCYSPGYWWFGYDYPWFRGWNEWVGCKRPQPVWWWRGQSQPPEIVAEREVEIGADGTVAVDFDTDIAKALHGDTDHEYTITAEVRDESRRTIVGTGKVLVARKPFKVFTWVDRGYFRVGDTVNAHFSAQTLNAKPVTGKGELTLLKITYDEKQNPVETPVQTWKVDTTDEGRAALKLDATTAGQFRLSYKLTDSKQHTQEGGYLFTVVGEGFDGKEYRFNNIELIPDQREYKPGDKVKLQINTDRSDSTVLLFIRPANSIYLPPKVLRMKGKSAIEEIGVVQKDMPNFFIEAMTITDGKVHSETKELVVPPEKRVLNVELLPTKTEFKPGEKTKLKVRLTDFSGENFVGSTVLTVYDKSVEYIAGGSNIPDIKEFFWKWRRHHHPQESDNLADHFRNWSLPNKPGMSYLGVFGHTVAEETEMAAQLGGGPGKPGMTKLSAAPGFGGGRGGMANRRGLEAMDGNMDALAANGARAFDGIERQQQAGAQYRGDDKAGDAKGEGQGQGAEGSTPVEPTIRSNFADTALWVGAITTDKTGVAEVDLALPESLTTWKVKAWGMGHGSRVGSGETELITRKNLMVRLQAPRFFVQKDEVVLSANIHNYLKTEKEVNAVLEVDGELMMALDHPAISPTTDSSGRVKLSQKVTISAGGERRVDWRVRVEKEGTAVIRVKALTNEESDAMEMKLPVFVHGMLKTESWAGTVRPDQQTAKLTINVPRERRIDQSVLEIRYSPSLAGAMVDALPYMAEYPYGSTDQTLTRFLPTVVTQKVLREMGLNLADIRTKRSNLNAQEIGTDAERAKQWKRFDRNPVFDEEELNRMVKDGLKALTNMQCADGGWGWFSGYGEHSWPHTTAVVVHGLQIAKQNDVPLVPSVLERGVDWLKRYQADQVMRLKNAATQTQPWKAAADNLDAFVYMVLVDAKIDSMEMRNFLYRDRNHLAVYGKAMFGLALHTQKDEEKLKMILENIEQFLVQDAENETAYLRLPETNYWWHWYGSEIEADAYYLKLLTRTNVKNEAAPRLVKYLLNNRKHATYWNSTRDTATCIEAFADYIRASGETKPDMFVEVWIDEKKVKEVQINAANLFTFDNKLVLAGADVKDGTHTVELRRRGTGPVYFNTYLTNFTLEDPITRAGLEIKVERKFYKLTPIDKKIDVAGSRGQALKQKVEKVRTETIGKLGYSEEW